MINDVAKMKRKEDFVCKDLMKGLIYNDGMFFLMIKVLLLSEEKKLTHILFDRK